METARAVVIGGGITGCSVAYHLALSGWRDVVLVEKGELTSGSTCHAAGLVTQFNPSATMMRLRRYSIELYERLGVFERVGGVRIASTAAALADLERGVSRARGIGLDVDVISPAETLALLPAASAESLHGAVWLPGDGYLDPHGATHALAAQARSLGVRFRLHDRVRAIELGRRREVCAVICDGGRVETEVVVNAAGIWAPQLTAMVGGFAPSTPVDHQHIALKAVAGHELPRDMPCFRDTANLVYGKAEAGGILFGGYEPDPVARWIDGVPWEHGARSLPPDEERFAELMAGAVRRFAFLADAGVAALVCHPDAITPDAAPLVGALPGVRGFYVAAGLSLNGFGGAGGIGKAIAELVCGGETEHDLHAYRPWRFGPAYREPRYAATAAREAYRYYYRQRFPFDVDEWGRPHRVTPLHGRLQDLGAVFGAKAGWERADWFEPGRAWRRAGADQGAYGFTRPPFLDRLAVEHRALRERVGILDLSSFGKISVEGPDALRLLEHCAANRIDRPVGRIVYTPLLDARGGIVADVTVSRLGEQRFRVVSGAGAVASDLGWLRLQAASIAADCELRDESAELAVIALWGPRSRSVLAAVCGDDVSARALPFARAAPIRIGGADVLAGRTSYVGELGFEFFLPAEWAVPTWDRLVAAGADAGLEPCGYRVLEGLRLEKGYRAFGTDLSPAETPFTAGLGALVRLAEGDFVGRAALVEQASRPLPHRLSTLRCARDGYVCVYGGEAVYRDGAVIGRITSAAYGFTVGAMLALARLPADLEQGAAVEVDVLGRRVAAEVVADVLHDPAGERLRS